MINLQQPIKQAISIAQAMAKEHGQQQFSVAHVLQALLHNEIGLAASLATWGKDIHYLREWADLRIQQLPKSGPISDDPVGDKSVSKLMEVAEIERLKLGQDQLSPEALLAAICKVDVAFTAEQLKSFPLSEEEVLKGFISDNDLLNALASSNSATEHVGNGKANSKRTNSDGALYKYCVVKTELATEGNLDPIIGRDKEIREMIEVLGRRSKPNPIIVGEPGVGKTALVDGFANMLYEEKVPDGLKGAALFELDSGALIAGASYKGEIEERLKKIVTGLKQHGQAILFIDEIHMLLDPNAGFGGAANLLKPELARGEITVIGATTNKEYREYIENDPAFSRRFEKVKVDEPDVTTAIKMVSHIVDRYKDHHGIHIADDALTASVHLAKRYLSEKRLPDAAIDLIDNTMSAIKMAKESSVAEIESFKNSLKDISAINEIEWMQTEISNSISPVLTGLVSSLKEEGTSVRNQVNHTLNQLAVKAEELGGEVTADHIAAVVASKKNIPIGKLKGDEQSRLLSIEDILRKRVVGQDGAIATISKAILESRAGLKKAGKPVGSFFFTGPTGTGKTELAKSLAEFLFNDESALIRFDMSEFKESVSAALLYGASPGYVGYKEGGLLVNKIREKPYSIVLFDEIEKAHSSVFDVFLQILDEGRLTDKQGRVGDFSNAVILFTSNLGQQHIVNYTAEHGCLPNSDWVKEMYINDPSITFRPEFLGRMDSIVPFNSITEDVVVTIFNIQLKGLVKLLAKQGIQFSLSEEATKHIAMKGFNPKFGARPIRDIIQKMLRQPLSQMIISGALSEGKKVNVTVKDEVVDFKIL